MTTHREWFGVDTKKRAARVRSHPVPHIVKEALSNSLDAGATDISITCKLADGKRRDSNGLRAFEVKEPSPGGVLFSHLANGRRGAVHVADVHEKLTRREFDRARRASWTGHVCDGFAAHQCLTEGGRN